VGAGVGRGVVGVDGTACVGVGATEPACCWQHREIPVGQIVVEKSLCEYAGETAVVWARHGVLACSTTRQLVKEATAATSGNLPLNLLQNRDKDSRAVNSVNNPAGTVPVSIFLPKETVTRLVAVAIVAGKDNGPTKLFVFRSRLCKAVSAQISGGRVPVRPGPIKA
jgi:hypothetical protein